MQSDKQYGMGLYRDILRDAAAHRVFVDFHGTTVPRGWARTFPNLLSLEAIAGAEQYWSTNFAEHAHTFHTIYPYTRNAIGSMDYTPVIRPEQGGQPYGVDWAFESRHSWLAQLPPALCGQGHVQPGGP